MTLLYPAILSLVDSVVDLLPLDASAHIQLATRLFGKTDFVGLPHLAAALAIMAYLWRDMTSIAAGLWKLRKRRIESGTRLLGKMLLGALPLLVLSGGWLRGGAVAIDALTALGAITIVGALIMLFADRLSLTVKRVDHVGVGTSLAVGLVQLVSAIPGVGRTTVAVTMARLFGMEREDAFRFTLLISLPILWYATFTDAIGHAIDVSDLLVTALGTLLSLAVLAIGFAMMRRSGLLIFALYRLLFGLALFGLGML